MRIDWVVALIIFLMFAAWAFSYYTQLNSGEIVPKAESAFLAGKMISEYMMVPASSTPASFSSASAAQDVTLWVYMNWTADTQNTTRVAASPWSGGSLPCMISGDRLYWKANLTSGDNRFFIEQALADSPPNCDQAIAETDENQAVLWADEGRSVFTGLKNAQLCATMNDSYRDMKSEIGVNFDFSVLIQESGSEYSCGLPLPRTARDIFVFPVSGALFDGGQVNVSVRLW